MMMRLLTIAAAAGLSACGDIPKDPDGTAGRVRSEKLVRVGLIDGTAVGEDRQRLFLAGVAGATGARPAIERGAAEPLLARLEQGSLDLVLGPMTPASPWQRMVHFLPPLGEQVNAEEHLHVVAMAKNGENEWIAILHREARKVAAIR